MSSRANRRQFLRDTSLAGIGFWVAGGVTSAKEKGANEKLSFACIGVGGKGGSDTDNVGNLGNIVALCDVDDRHLESKAKKYPQAKKFNDFRKMFDELGKSIDAVTVSTPDHTHAAAALMAMRLGKHVYCQKPLTHTVHEARLMRETAREKKVCTQMGNQGTAENGLREAVEVIRSGAIGPVREVHVWTNRPIWPQGTEAILKVESARQAAFAALHGKPLANLPSSTPPDYLHWEEFLGPAPFRPYDKIYHPFSWRGWWDFGTGALGDMACHTANMAFMALKLGSPTTIEAKNGDINPETYPTWATITFQFPERGEMPPVKFVWYEGLKDRKKNLPPEKLFKGEKNPPDSGSLIIGDKGTLYSPNDYGASYVLLPRKDFEGFKKPEPSLPRNGGGDQGQKNEWVRAIMENNPSIALSNFDYAGLLTETILLGNVAMRAGGKLEWDAEQLKFRNNRNADAFLRTEYRPGWGV
jgi:predicted dehydrogenase